MSRRQRFHPQAQVELEAAALWYEEERGGFGSTFIAAVMEAVEEVADWPGLGAPVAEEGEERLRQVRVEGFPYHVGYLATDEELRVLAVAHERRRPGYWTSRR